MVDLSAVDRFAQAGPVSIVTWLPEVDHYLNPTPVLFMRTLGNVVAWYPAFSSSAIGDVARQVVVLGKDSLRVDFDTQTPLSIVLRRSSAAEVERVRRWLKGRTTHGMQEAVQAFLERWQLRGPLPKRDKLFQVSFWLAHDFRLGREVPAGVVIPTEDNQSLEWVPMPGWEAEAFSRNKTVGRIQDPVATMVSIAERPGQNHSISYPEYIRAADRQDAIALALNRQSAALVRELAGERGER